MEKHLLVVHFGQSELDLQQPWLHRMLWKEKNLGKKSRRLEKVTRKDGKNLR